MQQAWDVAIVGGGAAGLMAAIFAGRTARELGRSLDIAILDGAARLGAKILVSGGGRCNVTHDVVNPSDFAGGSRNTIKRILRSFTVKDTVAFFEAIGVKLKVEATGKLFPVTDRARTVLDALLKATRDAGVNMVTDCRVRDVRGIDDGYMLDTSRGSMSARRLILATGGLSLPKTGSDGAGLRIARQLGHTTTPTMPALVPLVLPDGHYLTALTGMSTEVELSVAASTGKVIARQRGSMLFTHFGISGPVVLDISRHLLAARQDDPDATLAVNFTIDGDFDRIDQALLDASTRSPRMSVLQAIRPWAHERLARALIMEAAGLDPATTLADFSRDHRRALVRAVTALPLPVVRDRGYKHAEVTAGGVCLSEVDPGTMASRVIDGLHLCGEILDVDGRVGGYNFQWAWCTGRLAGIGAVKTSDHDPS